MDRALKQISNVQKELESIESKIKALSEKEFGASGIVCPKCKRTNNRVKDTRNNSGFLIRRRKCSDCGYCWNTKEIITAHHCQNK